MVLEIFKQIEYIHLYQTLTDWTMTRLEVFPGAGKISFAFGHVYKFPKSNLFSSFINNQDVEICI